MKPKILLVFIFLWLKVVSQQNSIFSLGAASQYGIIFAHSQEVQNTENANPVSFQLDATWQKISLKTWENCHCYPRIGVSLIYFNFDNAILGHSITPAYFIEPSFKIYKSFDLVLKAQAGISFLSNPYDQNRNPNNMSYSLPVTGYIGLGFGTHFKINNKVFASLLVNYLHISNGGIKDPNKGIDWAMASAGLSYIFNPTEIPTRKKPAEKEWKKKKPRIDVYALVSSRLAQTGEKNRYAIYGAGAGLSKQVGIISALVAGFEWHVDLALEEKLKRENRSGYSPHFAGLLAGHEFLLGKFLFSQQLGYYLYRDVPDFIMLYHRWGLMYRFNKRVSVGINLKAYVDHVHFFDARMMYSF